MNVYYDKSKISHGAKLLCKDQEVGDGRGWWQTRDLYQNPNGDRVSVRTSKTFEERVK